MSESIDLDPVIHAQARLRVVSALSILREDDKLGFPRLQDSLRMTAGNLSVHLRKLEDAGYVEVTKTHQGRTPATFVRLTRRGRRAFVVYQEALQALLNPHPTAPPAGPGPTEGPPTPLEEQP
jgi:DNA-binding MarR family transcriptional regulator